VFFKRKNGWGSFDSQSFGTTKIFRFGNGFEIKIALGLQVLLLLEWKQRQEKDYPNCNATRHPLSQKHEARRKFCPSFKSGGIAHSTVIGLDLIILT